MSGCTHKEAPQPASDELKQLDSKTNVDPTTFVPEAVAVSLKGTAYLEDIQGARAIPDRSGYNCLLVTRFAEPVPITTGTRDEVNHSVQELISHLVIPLSRHHINGLLCQVLVLPTGARAATSVGFVQVKLSEVDLSNLQLGDTVPLDRLAPKIKRVMDTWSRLLDKPAVQAGSDSGAPASAQPSSSSAAGQSSATAAPAGSASTSAQ